MVKCNCRLHRNGTWLRALNSLKNNWSHINKSGPGIQMWDMRETAGKTVRRARAAAAMGKKQFF